MSHLSVPFLACHDTSAKESATQFPLEPVCSVISRSGCPPAQLVQIDCNHCVHVNIECHDAEEARRTLRIVTLVIAPNIDTNVMFTLGL